MRISPRFFSSSWETVIGLELHIQIKSPSKLFSGTKTSWDDAPNSNVSLFDAGYPGTLPILSRHPVKQGLLTALAFNCHIPPTSQFDRKHYFYHDQPLGYQITQHYHPLALAGHVVLPTTPSKTVRIHQIQLEQDTAKSTTIGREVLIDFNRAGIGLMEVVTEADISSAEEATLFVKTSRGILRRIGTSDADMDKGSLRVDCNISVNRTGSPRGTRTEIKNLNSLKNLSIAVASEIKRQCALVDAGLPVLQETRGFDESIMDTVSSRSKEGEKDYRYMPDGNLPVLRIDPTYLETLRSSLPELPLDTISRLQQDYPTLSEITPSLLLALDSDELSALKFFEEVTKGRDPRLAGNWISQELVGALSREGLTWEGGGREKVSTVELGEVLDLFAEGKISAVSAKLLLSHLIKDQISPESRVSSILHRHSLLSLSSDAVEQLCETVLAQAKPGMLEMIQSSKKPGLLGGLVGQAMKKSGGRADAKLVGERLKELLGLE